MENWIAYVCMFASNSVQRQVMAEAEENRVDVQAGASSGQSGTTSLVSKGSSPWLLGFALEHGGLTQTTDGNTITFRGNVANSIRALLRPSYRGSYEVGATDPLVQGLARLSFGVAFDSSSNQTSSSQAFSPSKNTFSGFSAKYEIVDHRDPRDARWADEWEGLAGKAEKRVAENEETLNEAIIGTRRFKQVWLPAVEKDINNLPPIPPKEEVQKVVERAADLFNQLFSEVPQLKAAGLQAVASLSTYLAEKDQILGRIRSSPIVSVEYSYGRQLGATNLNIAPTTPNQQIPSLSNINLVLEDGFKGANAPDLTFNAGTTWFDSSDPSNPKRGRVRDYKISAEFDFPLREIANVGRPVLSFSGQFLSLLEEPLGDKVMLNGVTIDRRGNMGVFQTKLSIPMKDSGVKIPISFTYASRTELIKESDVRGNIGITFDLDTLFSKVK